VSDNLKGQAYMVVACFFFASAWIFIRYASETLHPVLIVFYRNLFGFLALTPFFLRHGRAAFRTDNLKLYAARGVFTLLGTYGIFYAVSTTPLATVVAITYAAPIFAALGAILILKETIHMRRVMAIVIGFIGVMIVIRPVGLEWTPGLTGALIGAVAISVVVLTIKVLSKTDMPETIVAYSFGMILPVSGVIALFFWQWPTMQELIYLLIIGFGIAIAQIAMTRAFKYSDTMAVLPLDFVRLLLATGYGIWLFGEPVDVWVWVGSLIILTSTIYTSHREAVMAREEAARKDLSKAVFPG
jgi:drug/metabolite transporter (DMT)-like permease